MRQLLSQITMSLLCVVLCACNLTAPAVPPTPPPTPNLPRVQFNAPINGATVFENILLDVDLVAMDETAGITRVEFYIDGELFQEATPDDREPKPVFRVAMNWLAEGVGTHSLSAIAYRPDGTGSESAAILVEVVQRES